MKPKVAQIDAVSMLLQIFASLSVFFSNNYMSHKNITSIYWAIVVKSCKLKQTRTKLQPYLYKLNKPICI